MTREDLVRIARDVVTGVHRPRYCANPAAFDPHEWVLEAMQRAYERGQRDLRASLPDSTGESRSWYPEAG